MKKYILIFTILFSVYKIYAQNDQVAIGSSNPEPGYALTVDGNIKATELAIQSALPGMMYTSNGPGEEPEWKIYTTGGVSVPNLNFLLYSKALNNFNGITFNSSITSNDLTYEYDESMTNWTELPKNNQDTSFKVQKSSTKVFVTFESVAQVSGKDTSGSSGVNYACGIFMGEKSTGQTSFSNYKLKGVRVFTVNRGENNSSFRNITLSTEIKSEGNFTFDPNKQYDIKIGCRRRSNFDYTGDLSIGKAQETNINTFITRSFLKINTFEPL